VVEPAEAAEQIRQAAEEERAERGATDRFRTRAAIGIAVLAMLLAMASLGGENATKEMVNANIRASDTWAFFQAKNIRQTSVRLASEELELLLPSLPPAQQEDAKKRIDAYKATVARYESEPDPKDPTNPLKGEGKKELTNIARDWEKRRDHAQAQDPNFDYSTALYQIAIVLGSVAIVASSRGILWLSLGMGTIATVVVGQ